MVQANITQKEAKFLQTLIQDEVYEHSDFTELILAKMELISGESKFEDFNILLQPKLKSINNKMKEQFEKIAKRRNQGLGHFY